MSRGIKILIVSGEVATTQTVRDALSGNGSPGAMRVRQDFVQRWQLAQRQSNAAPPKWMLSSVQTIDAATDGLESFVNEADTHPLLVIVDSDVDEHEAVLLFLLTVQAVAEEVQIVLVSRHGGASMRSAVEELGNGDRCTFLRHPVPLDEWARILTFLAWRGLMTLNLRNAEQRGFSGVGAADLANAMILESDAEKKRMAVQDALTKLGNRRLFDASIAEVSALSSGSQSHALLLIDLDRFKAVNDTMGHGAGDSLLQQVADRLRQCAARDDVLFRLGGDEFAIIKSDTDGVQEAAEAIIAALDQPFEIEGRQVRIGASIGWSPAVRGRNAASEWCARADAALYAAKGAGRGVAVAYSDDQDRARRQRSALEDRLRNALGRGQAPLLFSFLADPRSGAACGLEAVLDFDGDGRAETTMQKLDSMLSDPRLAIEACLWKVRSALDQIARAPGMEAHISLTPRLLLSEDAIGSVISMATASRIPPGQIILEAPAAEVFSQIDAVAPHLQRLREAGLQVVLRSFGVGLFSIQGLQRLRLDGVKLAAGLAKELAAEGAGQKIVAGLVGIAHGFGLRVLAAGADSNAEWNTYGAMGCVRVQGRVVSTLMTIEGARQVLASSQRKAKPEASERISLQRTDELR